MKNVTVGECKTGKKKKKTKFKSVGECKSGKTPTQAWKKKTEFKSVGECKSGKKKNKGQKLRKMLSLESEKK